MDGDEGLLVAVFYYNELSRLGCGFIPIFIYLFLLYLFVVKAKGNKKEVTCDVRGNDTGSEVAPENIHVSAL